MDSDDGNDESNTHMPNINRVYLFRLVRNRYAFLRFKRMRI